MKVRIDRELCIGISNCVAVAPSVFQLDKENIAVVIDPSTIDEKKLYEAAAYSGQSGPPVRPK